MRRAAPWALGIASLALNCYLLWVGGGWVGRVFPGFFVVDPLGMVMSFLPASWTGAQAGLHHNDQVIRFDGIEFRGSQHFYEYAAERPEGAPIGYLLQSPSGRLERVKVPTMRLEWPDFVKLFVLADLLGGSLLLFGLIVYGLKPEHPASAAFLSLGVTGNALFASQVGALVSSSTWLQLLMVASLPLFAASLAHLDLVFPVVRPLVQERPRVILLPYLISILALIPFALFSGHPVVTTKGGHFLLPIVYGPLYGPLGLILCLLPTVVLVWSSLRYYQQADTPLARQRSRLTLAGVIACFPAVVVLVTLSEVGAINVSLGLLGLPVWVFLATIGYAIVRYRLLDIRVAVGRGVLKLGVIALVTLAYTALAAAFGGALSAVHLPESPVAVAAFIGVALIGYAIVHERLSSWGERTFFPERQRMLEELGALGQRLGLLTRGTEVAQTVVEAVRGLLRVEQIHMLVRERAATGVLYRSLAGSQGVQAREGVAVEGENDLVTLLKSTRTELFRDELLEDRRLAAMRSGGIRTFDRLQARVLIPCFHADDLVAILALGAKRANEPYTAQDMNWLRAVAAQAASALTRASLIGERQMRQLVAAELKRFFSPAIAEDMVERGLSDEYRRREVSIVVTDLRGFTNFAERAEPEDLMDLLRQYHSVVGPLVFDHGGTITQFSGDGIVIIFGDPVQTADHAAKAAATALRVREALEPLFEAWASKGFNLGLGVGISTGFATCGYVGFEGRREYTALGKVVNTAARLCDSANPGQILATLRTVTATGASFRWEPVGSLSLKGLAEPVAAFNLVGLDSG